MHRLHGLFVALRPGDLQYLRVPVENFLRLCAEAAGDDHLAVFRQRLADRIERFVDRRIDEAAGVDDHEIRGLVARGHLIAFGAQAGQDALRVDQRLGAA